MGYESRIYAVYRCGFPSTIDGYKASITESVLEMGKMVYSPDGIKLKSLFDTETDFAIYTDVSNENGEVMDYTVTDPYGDRITYLSDKGKAIRLLEKMIQKDNFPRYKWLLNFLRSFENEDAIYICHYGH